MTKSEESILTQVHEMVSDVKDYIAEVKDDVADIKTNIAVMNEWKRKHEAIHTNVSNFKRWILPVAVSFSGIIVGIIGLIIHK